MKLVLIQIGKTDRSYLNEGVNDYYGRINRYLPLEIITIPDLKNRKSLSQKEQKKLEAEKIIPHCKKGDLCILLDERGKNMTSIAFAEKLNSYLTSSYKRIVFVIGGPYGFHSDVYSAVRQRISMSPLTFSHQLVRLLFMEQLYRSLTIIYGHSYHNE